MRKAIFGKKKVVTIKFSEEGLFGLLLLLVLMGIAFGAEAWERFHPYFSSIVGDSCFLFSWYDQWGVDTHLRELFPTLFAVAMDRDASVRNARLVPCFYSGQVC